MQGEGDLAAGRGGALWDDPTIDHVFLMTRQPLVAIDGPAGRQEHGDPCLR